MEFITGKCPKCNGELPIPENRESIICMYCGEEIETRQAMSSSKEPVEVTDEKKAHNSEYVSAALEGCLYNLRTVTDPETKKLVFERIRDEIFEELEITGHQEAYYYDQKNYADMCLVEKGDFTQYMNEKAR